MDNVVVTINAVTHKQIYQKYESVYNFPSTSYSEDSYFCNRMNNY
jgi:hypothetical protein